MRRQRPRPDRSAFASLARASAIAPPPGDLGPRAPAAGRDQASVEPPDPGTAEMLAFQTGVEDAFDRIVALYRFSVQRFLSRTVTDQDRTEDLTQEVFLRVYRSRDRYQPTATFRTWLFTIAHRLALNEIRAVRRRRRIFADELPDPGGGFRTADAGELFAAVADPTLDAPGAQLEARELQLVLDRLIAALPENQRLALELQRTEDFSYQEIAAMLEVSVMAVKSLLVRARTTIRRGVDRYLHGLSQAADDNDTSH